MSEPAADDPLADRSADDTDSAWGDGSDLGRSDEEDLRRYVEDRPPHWEP